MIEKIVKNIIKYGKTAGKKGFTPGISGNISVRWGNQIIITATGSAKGYLDENDFAIIDFDGNQISDGKKPSSEKFLHIDFYRKRNDINAIFHVHSPYLTAFAASGKALDEYVLPEIVYCFDKIPLASYALPGSQNLVDNTSKYFENNDVILMENHGVIVGGRDIKDAFLKLELCEEYAKTIICAKILGGAKILTDTQVEEIKSLK